MNSIRNVHLMGVGGAGMSALAHLLKEKGLLVSGCDVSKTSYLDKVFEHGVAVSLHHDVQHLDLYHPDLIVYSSAISSENEELQEAQRRGVPTARRAEILSLLFNAASGIGIAGTHGKTTTSSMIALILETAGQSPTVAIGGELCDIGGNAKMGRGDAMVAELDESDGSFKLFSCHIAVVTNVDWDHVDHYPDIPSVHRAFLDFLEGMKDGGIAVVCAEDPGAADVASKLSKGRIVRYGWGCGWNWGATDVRHIAGGGISFSAHCEGKPMGRITLKLSGEHNVLNALAACAAAAEMGVPFEVAQRALANFRGAKRRLQIMGRVDGISIYDDYGHHPREVAATLMAVRNVFPQNRLVALFQPHRYTRTAALYKDFADILPLADEVFLLPVYPADEKPIEGVSSTMIAEEILREGHSCTMCFSLRDAEQKILTAVRPGDIFLTVGAGNVYQVGEHVLQALREKKCEDVLALGA